ncbi:hypothetical protein HNI00_07300 [Thermoleptolyngbya oregonensis NK1-22]|uniref:Uncharacterized protein n=1 Tax=Thermoleptolyngbya oregonensis NK1-22 TaxID=2547457 RepID=A0AA96YMP0_9CYAN|nr:hypothetical protein [Thermoleptolyngbya oregonensis]WOB42982.1 hypothetical protein HNI00_07300 [Thermoleptolyngbya oregonensis NK1-22]
MTMIPNPLLMPACPPKRGEAALFIAIDELQEISIGDAVEKCLSLGYQPEFRYLENANGFFMFLLLKYAKFEGAPPENLWLEDWSKLVAAFPGNDMAIRCPRSAQPGARALVSCGAK